MKSAFLTPAALVLAITAPPIAFAETVVIQRPAISIFADPNCMVKKREAKVAELAPIESTGKPIENDCIELKDKTGATFFASTAVLNAQVAAKVCRPRGGAPVATDMAGSAAGGAPICP